MSFSSRAGISDNSFKSLLFVNKETGFRDRDQIRMEPL